MTINIHDNFRDEYAVERDSESAIDDIIALYDDPIITESIRKRVPCIEECSRKEQGGICQRWQMDDEILCRDFVTGRIFNRGDCRKEDWNIK